MYTEFLNPIYGTLKGLPVIIIGVLAIPGGSSFICVDADGNIVSATQEDLNVDIRFNGEEWRDVSPGPEQSEE